jgi:hypothetical protein
MRKAVLLGLACLACGHSQPTTPAGRTAAEAMTSTSRMTIPLDFLIAVPCLGGEVVHLTGVEEARLHVTLDGAGGAHVDSSVRLDGVQGVGLTTGARYQALGSARTSFNAQDGGSGVITSTFVLNLPLIGQGTAPNIMAHETAHVTIGSDGQTVVNVDRVSAECRE